MHKMRLIKQYYITVLAFDGIIASKIFGTSVPRQTPSFLFFLPVEYFLSLLSLEPKRKASLAGECCGYSLRELQRGFPPTRQSRQKQ